MHPRDRSQGGWSAIIDPEEEGFGGEEEAQTDPQMVRNEVIQFSTEEKTTIDKLDPVTRAMLEADPDPPRVKVQGGREPIAPGGPAATPPGGARKLRLPKPGENAPKKSRNGGVVESYTPAQALPSVSDPASHTSSSHASGGAMSAPGGVAFSSESLVEKLSEGTGRADKQAKTSFLVEYKELVRAAAIGVVLLGGGVAYHFLRAPEPQAPVQMVMEPPKPVQQAKVVDPATKQTDPKTSTDPQPAEQPATPKNAQQKALATAMLAASGDKQEAQPNQQQPGETVKAATPMITVVSTPPGGTVEINGEAHGKTPLILRSPRNVNMLSIRIQLEKHKRWEQDVPANEAGHFTVNAQLEKL